MSGRAHRRLTGLLLLWLLPLPWAYARAGLGERNGGGPGADHRGAGCRPGEDNPRMLFILPWQAPTLPRHPEASLPEQAPELEGLLDPRAFDNLRRFRDSLDPLTLEYPERHP